jgi:hypothetical protein
MTLRIIAVAVAAAIVAAAISFWPILSGAPHNTEKSDGSPVLASHYSDCVQQQLSKALKNKPTPSEFERGITRECAAIEASLRKSAELSGTYSGAPKAQEIQQQINAQLNEVSNSFTKVSRNRAFETYSDWYFKQPR